MLIVISTCSHLWMCKCKGLNCQDKKFFFFISNKSADYYRKEWKQLLRKLLTQSIRKNHNFIRLISNWVSPHIFFHSFFSLNIRHATHIKAAWRKIKWHKLSVWIHITAKYIYQGIYLVQYNSIEYIRQINFYITKGFFSLLFWHFISNFYIRWYNNEESVRGMEKERDMHGINFLMSFW